MTKRFLALVLVCILAIPILAVPASASQVTGTQFDMFATGLGNLLNDIEYNILEAISGVQAWSNTIYQAVVSVGDSISSWFNLLIRGLANHFTNLQTWISDQTTSLLAPLRSIDNWLDYLYEEIVNGSELGQNRVGFVEGEVDEQTGQYDDAQEIIQEATRPDLDKIDVDLTSRFTPDTRYNNVFRTVFMNTGNPTTPIFYVYFFALTLSLVSYGIFGKR